MVRAERLGLCRNGWRWVRIELEQRFAGRLLRGERLLWAGQPRRGLLLVPEDFVLALLSAVFGLYLAWRLIGWSIGALPVLFSRRDDFPFILAGWLVVLAVRFGLDAHLRRGTFYAVTDRRILILREGVWGSFRALDRARLEGIELEQLRLGDIIVFAREPSDHRRFTHFIPSLHPTARFLGLADARGVFDLIQRTQPSRAAP